MNLADDWAKAKPVANLQADWDKATRAPESPTASAATADASSPIDKVGSSLRNAVGGVAEPIMSMASGAVGKVAGDVAGLGAIPMHAMGLTGEPQDVQRRVRGALTYEPRTELGKSPYNPLNAIPQGIGKGVEALAGGAERMTAPPGSSGSLRSAIGSGVGEAVRQLPSFVGMKAPGATEAAGAGLKGVARDVMQSALKPTLGALQTGKAAKGIDTLLSEGVNVSKGGAAKLQDKITGLNDQITTLIQNSPASIDKVAVADRLGETLRKFKNQVTPLEDVKAIQKAWDEFMDHPLLTGDAIPVQTAQSMKQGTTKALGDKAYGELKGADIEAQKTLARGLKEEIAKAVPEVRSLNAQESALLNSLSLVERRVLMEANKNPIGLGLLTTNPMHLAAWMGDRSGLFKSLVARMINTTSQGMAPLGTAGPALGMAITGQTGQQ